MNIKNISNRIINIGTTILRPDDTMPVTDQVLGTPAIKTLIDKGWLSTEKSQKTAGGAKNAQGTGRGKNGRKPSGAAVLGDSKGQDTTGPSQEDPGTGEGQ